MANVSKAAAGVGALEDVDGREKNEALAYEYIYLYMFANKKDGKSLTAWAQDQALT